jgi:ABC-type oligopeptide transport system substrate-binding subunit
LGWSILKKSVSLVAALLAAGLALTGCSTAKPQASFSAGSALAIGEAAPLLNLNAGVYGPTQSMATASDLAQLTLPGFYYHDATGALVANTAFGTVETKDKQTVTYTLTGAAKWSDGVPVSVADLALSYLAGTDQSQPGFVSSLRFGSLAFADSFKASGNSATVHFKQPVADHATALPLTAPAHLVGALAMAGSPSTDAAAQAVLDTATGVSQKYLSGLEQAFATKFATDSTNPNKTLTAKYLLTAGAYNIVSASASSVVLKANPAFTAGPKASVGNVTLSCFSSPDDLATAIGAKKVDLASPVTAAMSNLAQIQAAAKKAGYTTATADSGQNEVALLNYGKGSAFNAATWGNDPAKIAAAREGIFLFLPRAGIWSVLAGDSSLSKTDSLVFSSTDASYAPSVKTNGSAKYQFQDAEKSAEIWQAAKFDRTIKLRVLFDSSGPRGQQEYTELAQLGKLGGFDVQNISTDNPSAVLATGEWDLYLTNLGRVSTDAAAQAVVSGALTGFQSQNVSALLASVPAGSTLAANPKIAAKIDAALYAEHFGLPLFQLQNLVVWSSKFTKYSGNPGNSSVTWGYSLWAVSGKGN